MYLFKVEITYNIVLFCHAQKNDDSKGGQDVKKKNSNSSQKRNEKKRHEVSDVLLLDGKRERNKSQRIMTD